MTKEEIREYIKAHEELAKMLHRFMRHNDNIITSGLSEDEEKKMHAIFMNAYKSDVEMLVNIPDFDINGPEFKEYLQEEGISDFVEAKNAYDNSKKDIAINPLSDPSITKEQREGLEEFHRWLNRNCEKTGRWGDKEGGGMRDFANKFMSQPASVQLKALYLLETGKRKAPDEAGFDDYNSQVNYVPSLAEIKKPLIASPLKIWKRATGDQFYWGKLNQALSIAEKSKDKLESFREDLRAEADANNVEKYSNMNKLTGFKKLIDAEKIVRPYKDPKTKNVTMVIDRPNSLLVANCQEAANMVDTLPLNEEQKEKFAEEELNRFATALPQLDYKRESTKTLRGAWEGGKDIVAQKENYQNAERSFKAILSLWQNESKALGNPPTPGIVAYLNSNKSFLGDTPSNLFDGLNLSVEVASVVNALVNIRKNYNDTNLWQKYTGTLDFAMNISDGTFHTAQLLTSASKIIPSLQGGLDTFKTISATAGGITGAIVTAKNATTAMKLGINRMQATNAKELAESSNLSDDEKKRVKDIAEFSHTKSVKAQHGAIRGMIKGAGLSTMAAGGTALATVPLAGPLILAGIAGTSIYDKVKSNKDRKELARLAVDKLVTGSEKMANKVQKHIERIQDRLKKYTSGDKTAKKLQALIDNQKQIEDRTRNEAAVKAGYTSLFTCTGGATSAVADELLKKVYLINPEMGFTKDNIITSSEEHADLRRERISYSELLESMGVDVKYKSHIENAKHFENRLKEKKAKQLGS